MVKVDFEKKCKWALELRRKNTVMEKFKLRRGNFELPKDIALRVFLKRENVSTDGKWGGEKWWEAV